MIEPRAALARWKLSEPTSVERMDGTNNVSWLVATRDGSYIVRLHGNAGNIPRIAYEHALLRGLSEMHLSFAVPAPVPSLAHRTLEPIESAIGQVIYFTYGRRHSHLRKD